MITQPPFRTCLPSSHHVPSPVLSCRSMGFALQFIHVAVSGSPLAYQDTCLKCCFDLPASSLFSFMSPVPDASAPCPEGQAGYIGKDGDSGEGSPIRSHTELHAGDTCRGGLSAEGVNQCPQGSGERQVLGTMSAVHTSAAVWGEKNSHSHWSHTLFPISKSS